LNTEQARLPFASARPLLSAAAAFMAGIALSEYPPAIPATLAFAGLLIFLPVFKRSRRAGLLLMAGVLIFCAGYLRGVSFNDLSGESNPVSALTGSRVEVHGVVCDVPERGRRTTHLCVQARSCAPQGSAARPCNGKVIVYIRETGGVFYSGDPVSFNASLRRLDNNGNPGEFDYAAYLRNRGFRAAAFLRKASSVKIEEHRADRGLVTRADALRGEIAAWMDASISDAQDAALLKALTIGLRKGISDEIQQTFARGGTAHLLSISGLHLGVIALLSFMLMMRMTRLLPRLTWRFSAEQTAALATLLPLWGFALLAGLRVSTMRSAITATVFLAGRMLRRPADGLNSLALAALIVLALYPFSLHEAAFQLSFMCVAAIIIGTPVLEAALPRAWRIFMLEPRRSAVVVRYLFFILVSSLLTFIATAPVLLAHFHQLSWMGLFSNLLLIPAVTLMVIPAAMCALLLHLAGLPPADFLLKSAALILDPLVRLQTLAVERLGGAWHFASLPLSATALYYISLALMATPWLFSRSWLARETKKRNAVPPRVAGVLLFCCAVAVYFFQSADAPDSLEAVVPHTRHGISVIIRDAEGKLDIAGSGWRAPEFGETVSRVLAPLLWETHTKEIRRIYLMQSRIDRELVERELGSLFDIGAISGVWRPGHSDTDAGRIIRLSRSGGGSLPALLYSSNDAALLIVGQPHLVEKNAWRHLTDILHERDLAVIWHGPGDLEGMRALARSLKPQAFVLAMDSKLSRYISRENWRAAGGIFETCARSDYDGALRLTHHTPDGWTISPAKKQ